VHPRVGPLVADRVGHQQLQGLASGPELDLARYLKDGTVTDVDNGEYE
jgi:hypothetical protein